MPRTILAFVVVLSLLMSALVLASPVSATPDEDKHCENHDTTPKKQDADVAPNTVGTITVGGVDVGYTISADGKTVTFDQSVDFCVKAALDNSGPETGTTFTVDWLNNGGQVPTISYFVVYGVTVDEPEDDAGIVIEKVDEQGEPLAGGIFTVEGKEGEFTTGADGRVCVDGLPQDATLTVTEIQAPAGYTIAVPASQEVETDEDGCDASAEVTFVNTLDQVEQPALGSITIIKDAAPDAAQNFRFTTTGAGLSSSFILDDDADARRSNQRAFTGLAAGPYTISEAEIAGWNLTSIVCSAGGTGDPATRTASITLVAGANVTCTFLNTQIEGGGNLPGGGGPSRGGTLGGNPMPNTAMLPELTGSAPAALAAVLMLIGLGAGAWITVAEARRRR